MAQHEDDVWWPDQEHTSDVEVWLSDDGLVRLRLGMRVLELDQAEARDLGLALVELGEVTLPDDG